MLKISKKIISFLFASLVLILFSQAARADWIENLKNTIDMEVAANFKNQNQVGIVVGVIRGHDTYIWTYGERALGLKQSPRPSTFFEIGSITKTFVGTLLALEANRGRVKLTDTIESLWPELKGTDAGSITLEQLATHTSGLERDPSNLQFTDPKQPFLYYDEQKLFELLKGVHFVGKGPFAHSYSNVGMGTLGYLLATKLNGLSFEKYLDTNLGRPMGLNDVRIHLKSTDLKRAATGNNDFLQPLPSINLNVLDPAGAAKVTAQDMLSYARFNMANGTDELSNAARLAREPRASTGQPSVQVGLAWFTLQIGDRKLVGHNGLTMGFSSILFIEPSQQTAVVVLSNSNSTPSCIWTSVFAIPCKVPTWKAVDPKVQDSFLGDFFSQIVPQNIKILKVNGFLALHPESQFQFRLWAKSDLEYVIPTFNAEVTFEKDSKGEVNRFRVKQNGGEFSYDRKKLNLSLMDELATKINSSKQDGLRIDQSLNKSSAALPLSDHGFEVVDFLRSF